MTNECPHCKIELTAASFVKIDQSHRSRPAVRILNVPLVMPALEGRRPGHLGDGEEGRLAGGHLHAPLRRRGGLYTLQIVQSSADSRSTPNKHYPRTLSNLTDPLFLTKCLREISISILAKKSKSLLKLEHFFRY
jgi:hypothetical protein